MKADLELVQLDLTSFLTSSSLANQAALFKPIILILTAVLTHLIVTHFGRGWPSALRNLFSSTAASSDADGNWMVAATEWLSITPLIIVAPIVFLALFEMKHRNIFEDEMSRAIGEEDMREIDSYYSVKEQDGKSGFWVLEYDGRIIGTMGLDGRKPGQQLDSTIDLPKPDPAEAKKVEDAPATAPTEAGSTSATPASPYPLRSRAKQAAVETNDVAAHSTIKPAALSSSSLLPDGTLHLRRFATSLSFRPADIEDDLLSFVSNYAFSSPSSSSSTERVVISCRPAVEKTLVKRLKKNGWTLLPRADAAELSEARGKKQGGLVEMLWPLDLGTRTFAISRGQWEKQQRA